jgi:hypothetical protein
MQLCKIRDEATIVMTYRPFWKPSFFEIHDKQKRLVQKTLDTSSLPSKHFAKAKGERLELPVISSHGNEGHEVRREKNKEEERQTLQFTTRSIVSHNYRREPREHTRESTHEPRDP